MKKFGVFLLAIVLVCSIAFPAFADEVITMRQVTPEKGVTEVYIDDTNFQSDDLSITMISNEAPVEKANDSSDLEPAQPLTQAAEIHLERSTLSLLRSKKASMSFVILMEH